VLLLNDLFLIFVILFDGFVKLNVIRSCPFEIGLHELPLDLNLLRLLLAANVVALYACACFGRLTFHLYNLSGFLFELSSVLLFLTTSGLVSETIVSIEATVK